MSKEKRRSRNLRSWEYKDQQSGLAFITSFLDKADQIERKNRIFNKEYPITVGMSFCSSLSRSLAIFFCGLSLLLSACESGYGPRLSEAYVYRDDDRRIEGEQYNELVENPFLSTEDHPTSSFAVDADGGAYSNVRRLIRDGIRPPAAAIRSEEFINYFPMDHPDPAPGEDIGLSGEVSACPWAMEHRLVRIGLKGRPLDTLPASNLVLLIDVSGSMRAEDKLPLLQQALTLLVEQLRPIDRIALVTYSGQSEVVLPSTSGGDKVEILAAIQELEAGGGTAGEAGIHTAYQIAEDHFIPNGNNRVIMATDGDFNLGVASQDELIALIEEKRDSGVLLTTIGTGSGNYQEGKMEQLANHGNGTYEYLDDLTQARKLFVQEYSKLFTVAIDVKVQVIFNPTLIQAYRLIGYENRTLDQAEFERDSTDAGEIGAGQTITALYEVVPQVDASTKDTPSFTVQFRYKKKPQSPSRRLSLAVVDQGLAFEAASEDHRWASAMASAALVLRASTHRGTATFATVLSWMEAATEHDPYGYREEAIKLMRKAQELYN